MNGSEALCEQCGKPIDLSREHITITRNVEQWEGDEVEISESAELAHFCSRGCCDQAMGALPFYSLD